jgi:hypothetical protein
MNPENATFLVVLVCGVMLGGLMTSLVMCWVLADRRRRIEHQTWRAACRYYAAKAKNERIESR